LARINGLGRFVSFVIRSERVGTAGFLEDIQAAVWSVNGNLPLAGVQTMGDLYQRSMARTSLTLVLLAITGAMALRSARRNLRVISHVHLATRGSAFGWRLVRETPA
jgi:uncharacterized membrane protein YoaK (UPF0700 family)